jgi:hypothetical protein
MTDIRKFARNVGIHELQFGRWGFRINNGYLHSFATIEEAVEIWILSHD